MIIGSLLELGNQVNQKLKLISNWLEPIKLEQKEKESSLEKSDNQILEPIKIIM